MTALRTMQVAPPPDVIDLGIGQPSVSLLPLELIERAAHHRLAQGDRSFLAYGAEEGHGHFRLALARFLTARYGAPVEPTNLFVTAGTSQALDMICTLFARPGDVIYAEEPTYFLALRIFADHGLKVVGLPVDEQGLVVDALEERLADERPAFLYTIPTFQNPTSVTMPLARRQRLVELSESHGFLIVADEVYHLLDYTAPPPLPLAAFAETGTVLSLGSFSKILAPGLRLGWIQAAPPLIERLVSSGLADSGGGLNPFTSAIVWSMLELGLEDEYLATLKTTYHRRVEALSAALREHLPDRVAFREPGGGFFFWLQLPPEMDAEALLEIARRHKAGFQPGVRFSSRQGLRNAMRLSFAYYDADHLREGVARLSRALGDYREEV